MLNGKPPSRRITVLGYRLSSLVQWAAKEGYNFRSIRRMLNELGAEEAKDSTIRTAITDAKNEKYSRPARVRDRDAERLKAILENRNPPEPKPEMNVQEFKEKTGSPIRAQYGTVCKTCGGSIHVGDEIVKDAAGGWSHAYHARDSVREKLNRDLTDTLLKNKKPLDFDLLKAKLDGMDALSQLQEARIKELEDQTAKQAKQIELLRKEQPPRELVLIKPDKKKVQLKEHVHPIFEQLLFHIQAGDNVMIVGPRGCGKTTVCEQLAKALGRTYGFQSLSGGVTEAKLFGRVTPDINTGKNIYHRALFVELFEEGGVFLLDEVDAADPNVLLSVNSGLANGQLALDRPKTPIAKRHEHFVCVAAANTWGNGADRQYVGRNQQDSAFTERFVQLGMNYDAELERALCPGADELLTRMHKYRENIGKNRLERTVSTRFICRAYKWLQMNKDLEYIDQMCFAGWREDEIRKAKGGY